MHTYKTHMQTHTYKQTNTHNAESLEEGIYACIRGTYTKTNIHSNKQTHNAESLEEDEEESANETQVIHTRRIYKDNHTCKQTHTHTQCRIIRGRRR